MPGLSHWSHPRFFGYFPCNGDLSSVLGDFASTGLGVLGLAWQSSPALTEIEEVATDWLRQMLGLSPAWSGVIQDTASTSTLARAALRAREDQRLQPRARRPAGRAAPLVVYASAHSHSSVDKAALLAGFGRENVRHVAARRRLGDAARRARGRDRRRSRRRPRALRRRRDDRHDDDDGASIRWRRSRAIARAHGLWLHVDAAMAGSAMVLPECRWMWDGIERRRLGRRQPAQVARRRVRLLRVLRARAAATSSA